MLGNKESTHIPNINVNQSNSGKFVCQNNNDTSAYKNSSFSYQPRPRSPMLCFKFNKAGHRKSECRSNTFVLHDNRNTTQKTEEPISNTLVSTLQIDLPLESTDDIVSKAT